MFLFMDESFTLINKYGFFYSSCEVLCLSSHCAKIIYTIVMTCDIKNIHKLGEGDFKFSLNLSLNFLADSTMYSSWHCTMSHIYLHITPLFCVIVYLSLGPPGSYWWYCLLWCIHACNVCCEYSWNFHWALSCKLLSFTYVVFLIFVCFVAVNGVLFVLAFDFQPAKSPNWITVLLKGLSYLFLFLL